MYCNRELISDLIFVVVILKESSFQCICFNHWNTKTEMPNCWEVIFLVFRDIKDWPQMQRKLSGKRFRDSRELSTCHITDTGPSAGSGLQTCQQIISSKWSDRNSDHIGKFWGKRFRDFRELSTCQPHHRHRSTGSGPPANLSTNDSSKMSNDHTRIVDASKRARW